MGDRRMCELKTPDGTLYIYTHWHGSELPKIVKKAMEKAKPRLGDWSYWLKIMVDQITKDGRDEETGWGILLEPKCEDEYNNDSPSVLVDGEKETIKIVGGD